MKEIHQNQVPGTKTGGNLGLIAGGLREGDSPSPPPAGDWAPPGSPPPGPRKPRRRHRDRGPCGHTNTTVVEAFASSLQHFNSGTGFSAKQTKKKNKKKTTTHPPQKKQEV